MARAPQERVVIYDRIDANRRTTAVLLGLFALVFLPVAAYLAVYLMMWVALVLGLAVASFGLADVINSGDEGFVLFAITDAVISVFILLLTAYLLFRFAAALVLRLAGARPVGRDEETELRRTVENLCIGAGLPQPRLYLVESAAANAFSAGMAPSSASLAVTRGLLELLDRRELEGVLAHELSQIGNYDTRLSTVLAAGVGLLRLPLVIVVNIFRFLFRIHWAVGWGLLLYLGLPVLVTIPFGISLVDEMFEEGVLVGIVFIFSMVLPFYIFLGAPAIAYLLRRAVLRQREYLADADAVLLTRYPAGLARALAKMGAAGAQGMKAGPATAHLYIVDPLPEDAPWWDRVSSVHPPVEKRIALLARMGGGIPPSVLRKAEEAGAKFRQSEAPRVAVEGEELAAAAQVLGEEAEAEVRGTPVAYRLTGSTAVYERPDPSSDRVCHLPAGSLITVFESLGNFLLVIMPNDRFGYIPSSASMVEFSPGA